MLRLIGKWACCLPLLLLLSGCWGRNEVNDIGIVTATGLDLAENGRIRVHLLLAVPRLVGTSSMNGGSGDSKLESSAGWVVSEEGRTVMEAYRNIQGKLPRKIFFSHNRVVIIGEKLARQGIMPVLDFFERSRQSQLNSYILVTKSDVTDILEFQPKFEKLASEIMKEELKVGIGTSIHLGHFLKMMMESGEEPYAPEITTISSKINDNDKSVRSTVSLITAIGTAVFRQDKLIGWLNDQETRGLKWVRNDMKDGVITVNLPKELGGGQVSAEISTAGTRLEPIMDNDNLQMKVSISASLRVFENTSDLNLSEHIDKLNELFSGEIEQRVRLVCKKVQKELRSDVFGFGQSVYIHYPKLWNERYVRNWDEQFPDLQVRISTKATVTQTGMVGKDQNWKELPGT